METPQEQQQETKSQPAEQPQAQPSTDPSKTDGTGPVQIPSSKKISEYPIIRGPGAPKPEDGEKQGELKQEASPEEQQKEQPEVQVIDLGNRNLKFKFGDEEIDTDRVSEGLQSLKQKSNWEKKLTQDTQIHALLKNMPEDRREPFVNKILAYVYGKEKFEEDIPETFSIELKDEDGYEHEYSLDSKSDVFKKLYSQFENFFLQKYQNVFNDLRNIQGKLSESELQLNQAQMEAGEVSVSRWMEKHPEYAIEVGEDETLTDKMLAIMKAGQDHPNYKQVAMLMALRQRAQEDGISFEKAHKALYGDFVKDKTKTEQQNLIDKNKLSAPDREKPGQEQTKAITEQDKMLNWNRDKKAQKVTELFNRFEESRKK